MQAKNSLFCPSCRTEFRRSATICSSCGVRLMPVDSDYLVEQETRRALVDAERRPQDTAVPK